MKYKKSIDSKVGQFLEELMLLDADKFKTIQTLRNIVFSRFPKTEERMMYGGIMFSITNDFGGVFVRKNHISFEFGLGANFEDPDKLLEGTGKLRRHLKIKNFGDIEKKKVDYFVMQCLT